MKCLKFNFGMGGLVGGWRLKGGRVWGWGCAVQGIKENSYPEVRKNSCLEPKKQKN